MMVLWGDILHNFGDGISLGAAFSVNWTTGFGTAVALFSQEIPHEIGRFKIICKNLKVRFMKSPFVYSRNIPIKQLLKF